MKDTPGKNPLDDEALVDALTPPYRSIEDVVAGLARLEAVLHPFRDLRGVFATAYLRITRAIESDLDSAGFANTEWMAQYLVSFGNLYREALLAYEQGRKEDVPRCWEIAFDAARAREGLVIQHLTLGINAHINHDLALALGTAGIDPRDQCYADHVLVNSILALSTDALKKDVARMYAPVLSRVDRLVGRADDDLVNFSIPRAREHAWVMAVALATAPTERERRLVRVALDEQAAVLARLIMSSPTRNPAFLAVVRAARVADKAVAFVYRLLGKRNGK